MILKFCYIPLCYFSCSKCSIAYPIVRRVLRPRNLVKKMTRSEIYFSLIGNGIIAFGECPSLTGNMFLGVSN